MLQEIAKEILQKGYVCDHCLGRQFAQILSGMTNRERGKSIRTALAMEFSLKPFPTDKSNFSGFSFRGKIPVPEKTGPCRICLGLFDSFGKWAEEAAKKLRQIEFRTFLVSSILSRELVHREESLWEDIGIEYCEPIKSELNRELGKLIAEKTGKKPDEKKPDVTITLDLEKNRIEARPNPFYIYGRYQKLARGIPQTKWDIYRETVEEIIARPFMREAGGSAHSLHAAGREDIDARCLDWRPFVLEIAAQKKRVLPLKKLEAEINRTRKVKVSGLKYSDRQEVVMVKNLMPDKTYRVVASFQGPAPTNIDLRKLRKISLVKQQTPTRVLHRRADKTRAKKMKSVSWKALSKGKTEFTIRGSAGLYIKELVTGDSGRTRPSFSEILGRTIKVKELDVVKIHLPQRKKGFKTQTTQ